MLSQRVAFWSSVENRTVLVRASENSPNPLPESLRRGCALPTLCRRVCREGARWNLRPSRLSASAVQFLPPSLPPWAWVGWTQRRHRASYIKTCPRGRLSTTGVFRVPVSYLRIRFLFPYSVDNGCCVTFDLQLSLVRPTVRAPSSLFCNSLRTKSAPCWCV